MTSILNKNAILTGHVDSFCLACESLLRGDDDAILHIVKPIHKKNLEATSFMDKYKDDHVRKVKKGYYCEYCNIFMKTAAKVGPHITEAKHCEKKALQPLKREGNGVLAFDKVFIPENAWHGLTEDTCSVCDAEFDDNALLHKTKTTHSLNLVLAEIEIADGNVFRKVDDSTFQCLTCNLVCALNEMTEHFDSADHKNLYQVCCDAANNLINEPKKEPETVKEDKQSKKPENDTPKKETPKKSTNTEDPKKEEEAKKTPEVANVISNESKKKPETEKKPEAEKKPEPNKAKKAATNTTKIPSGMGKVDKEICEALGAVNYIATDVNNRQWCILCDWAMDQSAVQPHLNSKHHQTLLKMHKERAAQRNPENEDLINDKDEPKCNGKSDETSKVPNKESDDDEKAQSKSKIVDAANEFNKNNIKLDLINASAYCRVCSKSVDYDFEIIKNHIDEHKKAKPTKASKTENLKTFVNSGEKTSVSLVTSPVLMNGKEEKPKQVKEKAPKQDKEKDATASIKETDAEAENYAKENNLVYNKERNTAFCSVCITKVPPALKNMKEHINGHSHKSKVAQPKAKPIVNVITKEPSHIFVDEAITIENICHKDVVINDKYCLNVFSYFMMTKIGSRFRCQGCEVTLTGSQIDDHKRSPQHESIMQDAPVVSSEKSEFIREIRPEIFHCGFCNQLSSPWPTMEAHLKCTAHREAKTAANWRLQSYVPDIQQHRARQHMRYIMFNRMMLSLMFGDD